MKKLSIIITICLFALIANANNGQDSERPMSISEAHRDPATEFLKEQASKTLAQVEMPEMSPELKEYLKTHGMEDPLSSTTKTSETKKFDNHVEEAWSKLEASAENPEVDPFKWSKPIVFDAQNYPELREYQNSPCWGKIGWSPLHSKEYWDRQYKYCEKIYYKRIWRNIGFIAFIIAGIGTLIYFAIKNLNKNQS